MHSPVDRSKLGTLGVLEDGRKMVQFTRRLTRSVDDLWQAITDPEHLAHWFPGMRLERKEGGRFEIWFSQECEGPAHVTGTVDHYDPPHRLDCGSMRYLLVATATGCELTFSDILNFEGPLSETEVINSVLGGWHKYLDSLEYSLVGGERDPRGEPEFDYSTVPVVGRA